MSYSIERQAATKAELKTAIFEQLSQIPQTQPVHKSDIEQAFNAASSLIDLMNEDPERDLYCSVSGSIWETENGVQQVGVNINVQYQKREQ